jgi:hypothetical protein
MVIWGRWDWRGMWHVRREGKYIRGFGRKTWKKENTWRTYLRWENNTNRTLLVNRTGRRGLYLCGSGGDLAAGWYSRWWTFGFPKLQKISWKAEELSASQEGRRTLQLAIFASSMGLIIHLVIELDLTKRVGSVIKRRCVFCEVRSNCRSRSPGMWCYYLIVCITR